MGVKYDKDYVQAVGVTISGGKTVAVYAVAAVEMCIRDRAEPEVTLKQSMTAEDFLNTLRDALKQNQEYGFAGMTKLFGSKEFAAILKNRAEKQWLLEPEQLREASKVSDLYERLDHQMKQMENVMKAAGVTQNSFVQTAADIRSNIEFMNQMCIRDSPGNASLKASATSSLTS